ncbi:hypothetical protein [Peribacillus sp. RS7]
MNLADLLVILMISLCLGALLVSLDTLLVNSDGLLVFGRLTREFS